MRKRKPNKRRCKQLQQAHNQEFTEQLVVDFDAAISELLADEAADEEQIFFFVMSNIPS